MVTSAQLKFLLSDTESLEQYAHGNFVSFADVKRRLFLKARDQNKSIPDSYYLLAKEETFKDFDSLADILNLGVKKLAIEHLEISGKKIFIKPEKQTSWQELLTYIPPLFLQASFLHSVLPIDRKDRNSIIQAFAQYILPNTKYTALPTSRISQLDFYIDHQKGLHDMHMHLNGALETDQVWQDYLFNPREVYLDLQSAFSVPKVKEQLEQESHLLEAERFLSFLTAGQRLRQYFFDCLFPKKLKNASDEQQIPNKHFLLQKILKGQSGYQGGYRHPFLSLVAESSSYNFLMSVEALMYILILEEIHRSGNEVLAEFFHFYLLILGLTNRLLVQQTHQNGFDQFQKHTLNGLREHSERTYRRRYFQMHGNDGRHLNFLEGRFSPKKNEKDLINFIDKIWGGWETLCENLRKEKADGNNFVFEQPQLSLIAHFIKRQDDKPDSLLRHKKLRSDIWKQALILSLLLKKHSKYREKVAAVDAAANEFDAPPEVFSPVFRLMRRAGVKHFTYHAGEDFYHIPGGLRAIYEAIIFCKLQKGDRIGHATATGLHVSQWSNVIGNQILLRQGEYLDDLVFIYHLIITCKIEQLHGIVPFLTNKIQDLSYCIYNEHFPVSILEKAWLIRQCCPIHALETEKENASLKTVFNEEEWRFPLDAGFADSRQQLQSGPAWKAYQKYHAKEYRKEYEKIITVSPFEIVKSEHIQILQWALLSFMNEKEIIIETLPTSNVRIGFHSDFTTYHLYNWIKWEQEGHSIPPIVVGSDDTGIFATNIYNEYANIYCTLLYHHQMPHNKVMNVIKTLGENSRIYRFASTPTVP